jgi:hypothetical protein
MVKKFEVGKTYQSRSVCDHDCVFSHEILRRTPKTVLILVHGDIVSRRISIYDGEEIISPYGKYSMSPILRASRHQV